MMNKFLILLIPYFIFAQNNNWIKIHDEREYSVSGIARFNNGYLVVHDNKRKNQARVSHINDELKITKLIWPETLLPFDLEAIAALPNKSNHFILMESTGKCYEIIIDPTDFRIVLISTFTLRGITARMNLEGLTIYNSGQGLVFIYGDRGSDSRNSTLFVSFFDYNKKRFFQINTFKYDLPIPNNNKRNIADLFLKDDGTLWTAATSDPGNNGPFSSAIYELGEINHSGKFEPTHPELLKPIIVYDNQKVEALMFYEDNLVMMTDNENLGATFKMSK